MKCKWSHNSESLNFFFTNEIAVTFEQYIRNSVFLGTRSRGGGERFVLLRCYYLSKDTWNIRLYTFSVYFREYNAHRKHADTVTWTATFDHVSICLLPTFIPASTDVQEKDSVHLCFDV